jgi:hypothetical protein
MLLSACPLCNRVAMAFVSAFNHDLFVSYSFVFIVSSFGFSVQKSRAWSCARYGPKCGPGSRCEGGPAGPVVSASPRCDLCGLLCNLLLLPIEPDLITTSGSSSRSSRHRHRCLRQRRRRKRDRPFCRYRWRRMHRATTTLPGPKLMQGRLSS